MIFDFLILGFGALSRRIRDANNQAEGKSILLKQENMSVWERVEKQCCKSVTINGITHHFLTPHEIILNKQWWASGLELEKFLVKFYADHNNFFFSESVRMINKSGKEYHYSGYDVLKLYQKSIKNKNI